MTTETNFTFSFTDRATYLAYRADWKQRYAAQSEDIRGRKIAIKNAARAGQDTAGQQARLQYDRTSAREMMEELAAAKVEAQRQYLAKKEMCHAA